MAILTGKAADEGTSDPIVTRMVKEDKVHFWKKPNLRYMYFFLFTCCMGVEMTSGFDSQLINTLQFSPQFNTYFGNGYLNENGKPGIEPALLGFLNSCYNLGSIIGVPIAPWFAQKYGRRWAIMAGSIIMVIGALLQGFAQHVAMYIAARMILGVGIVFAIISGSALIGELAYPKERPLLTSLFNSSWYIGSIVACAISLGTVEIPGDWAWRIPSVLQIAPSLLQICTVFFLPESPRWLISHDRDDDAFEILTKYHAEGDASSALVQAEMAQIRSTIKLEMENSKQSWWEMVATKAMRKRVLLAAFLGLFTQMSGNTLISYYSNFIFEMMNYTSSYAKSRINIANQCWGLLNATILAILVSRFPRRLMFLLSATGMLLVFTAITVAIYFLREAKDQGLTNPAASIAGLFFYFAFSPCYNLGNNALTYTYLVEIFPYAVRSRGIGIQQIFGKGGGFFSTNVNPIALVAIEWKYMAIYCGWIAFEFLFIYFMYPETHGRTLEELAFLFEGKEFAEVAVAAVEKQVQAGEAPENTTAHVGGREYCSERCRERSWGSHRKECIGGKYLDDIEQMQQNLGKSHGIGPKPPSEYRGLWAKYAAADILNLEKNEGPYYDGLLKLLIVGDLGLRHLIYSVVNLPSTANPAFDVYLSEPATMQHFTRTLLALFILRAENFDPIVNAEAVIHLWYSIKIPAALYQHIKQVAFDPLLDIRSSALTHCAKKGVGDGDKLMMVIDGRPMNVRFSLDKLEWIDLEKYITTPNDTGTQSIAALRALDLAEHTESWQKINARMTPARALGLKRWRHDGLLLPYGQSRDGFDVINPLLVPPFSGLTAEPLSEWPMHLLDHEVPMSNDAYGKMFYYLRKMLVDFQSMIRRSTMSVALYAEGIESLPVVLQDKKHWNITFDRIEVGQLWDQNPMLTLVAATKLLRHVDENPFATLLVMSRKSVNHSLDSVAKDLKEEKKQLSTAAEGTVDQYAPPITTDHVNGLKGILRRQLGLLMWRNWDRFSDHYFYQSEIFKFNTTLPFRRDGEYSCIFPLGFLGLTPKAKNTVTRRWPNRVVHGKKSEPSMQDVDRWISWVDNQPERWLEWKKTEDVKDEVLRPWIDFAVHREMKLLRAQMDPLGDCSSTEGPYSETGSDADGEGEGEGDQALKDGIAVTISGVDQLAIQPALTAGDGEDSDSNSKVNEEPQAKGKGKSKKGKKKKRKGKKPAGS
ncbi:lactose permease [Paramyrothecium foliicola]|nr:lactose permease [Paramyrothecium foliicola]